MPNNTPEQGFVSIANLVAETQYFIDDQDEQVFYDVVLQVVLNKIRHLNVHYARTYREVPIDLNSDLNSGTYPQDLIKAISVGIYRNGEFWSFTRKPNMAKTVTGDGGEYDTDFNENEDIPTRGTNFASRGSNIGYWVEDDENCRFFVRNYDETKVILRYRSNGITCTTENCIPYKAKDLVVWSAILDLAMRRIPFRRSKGELEELRIERLTHYNEFTDLEYIPQNMDEFMDAQFASSNVSPKRGL